MSGEERDYRFYTIGPDGHIPCPAQCFTFISDARAVRHARRLVEDHVVEVWEGARLVATIRPRD